MAGTSAHTALGSELAALGARLSILPGWEKPEVLCPDPTPHRWHFSLLSWP